jgi:hypothetical protein
MYSEKLSLNSVNNSKRTVQLYFFQMYLMTKLGHRKQFIAEIMEDKYKILIMKSNIYCYFNYVVVNNCFFLENCPLEGLNLFKRCSKFPTRC